MKLEKFLIAGGNSTLLVWGCPSGEKNKVIKKYLGEVEQIGFVESKKSLPFLNMMGGELCINGAIALASLCSQKGKLFTSGLIKPIFYQNRNKKTSITLRLDYQKIDKTILFNGIGFTYLKKEAKNIKEFIESQAKKYNQPAFGAILYKYKKLVPYVYVVKTNSFFRETACGSGSLALSILTDMEEIIQPTGKIINIIKKGNKFTLTSRVKKIT